MTIRSRLKVVLLEHNLACIKQGKPSLTIRKIAVDTGLATSTLSGLTANRARRIDYETIDMLCKYLKVQPGDLFEYIPDTP